MAEPEARPARHRRWFRYAAGCIGLFLLLGVLISHQFPALTNGPKSSAELLAGLFKAPIEIRADAAKYVLDRVKKDAVIAFVQMCDAPAATKDRITRMMRGEQFEGVTVPFVHYLYELYGAPAAESGDPQDDLAYAELPEPGQQAGPEFSSLARHPRAIRKHAGNALSVFDALFLRLKPDASPEMPLAERYDDSAYAEIKAVVRELAEEMLARPSDAKDSEKSEYQIHLEETLKDDEKLSDFIEFFVDLTRELSDSWLESFVKREERKDARLAWVEERIRQNRYFEIADYAKAQSERKLAVHIAVDGLQGKLLEGLCQLSSGDRDGSGARYVMDLVRQHQMPQFDPEKYDSRMPPPLGKDIVELADTAPEKPDYLENFKKYFFSPDANAVIVNVATVDTPSISVRNLPIIYSGHAVAGPNGTGIPNFSYLDRATGRGWYFWGSDVLWLRHIFGNHEDRIPGGLKRDGPGARTLFERLWRYNTVSAMASIDTGALEKISSEVGVAVGEIRRNFIEKIIIQQFRRRAEMEQELNKRRQWLIERRNTSHSLLASLLTKTVTLKTFREYARFIAEHEDDGLPDYVLWYNPWPDHFAHGKGPYSDDIIGYAGEYDRLDHYLGKMIDVYESVPAIRGPGSSYADRTLFGVVSDHGLVYTPRVVSTDDLLFESMRRDGIDIKYLKITHDEGGMPAIHSRHRIKPTRPYDAVVGSTAGGSYIIDLFDPEGLAGDNQKWRRQPDYHELRQYKLMSGQIVDWIAQFELRLKEILDFAVVRENGPSPGERWPADVQSVVRIVAPGRGEARIYRQSVSAEHAESFPGPIYRYEILSGEDPLELMRSAKEFLAGGLAIQDAQRSIKKCIEAEEGCDGPTWQDVLSRTLRPDLVHQLSHLYDIDRAGTINVFPLPHVGMNSGVPGRHAGEAFGEKNGTQLYRGAGLKRTTIQTARVGSLPVTIYHWLVGDDLFSLPDATTGGVPSEQFGFPSLLNEPAFAPIRRPGD